ncbi:MAG: ExbD/TolR family protein [bacterium]
MEIFLSPVLNIFIILIPLLLTTAVFIQTSAIDLFLPSASRLKNPSPEAQPNVSKEKILILAIAPQGFYLILGDKLLKLIPKKNDYEYGQLEEVLQKVRDNLPGQQSIIIEADDDVIYDDIIHTIDRCQACGLTNISLSASKDQEGGK